MTSGTVTAGTDLLPSLVDALVGEPLDGLDAAALQARIRAVTPQVGRLQGWLQGAGLDAYAQAIGALEGSGAAASVIFMHPSSWTSLVTLEESAVSTKPVLANAATGRAGETQRARFGVPVAVTAGCPVGTAYVVDGSRVATVVRTDGNVEAEKSFRFSSDVVTIRATMRLARAVPYAESVVRISDVP